MRSLRGGRNRHCPRCQSEATEEWCEKLGELALPCRYALVTLTLPATLRMLPRTHQRQVYAILLREAAASVQALAAEPRYIGGQPGIVAVPHTWTRDMAYHPHAHLLVTAGGLTEDEEAFRLPAHRRFFFPGRALSVVFRAKVRDAWRG